MGRGQGCCSASYSAQDGPSWKELPSPKCQQCRLGRPWSGLSVLVYLASHLSERQIHREALITGRWLRATPEICFSKSGVEPESLHFCQVQVMLMPMLLLILEPQCENHCSAAKTSDWHAACPCRPTGRQNCVYCIFFFVSFWDVFPRSQSHVPTYFLVKPNYI